MVLCIQLLMTAGNAEDPGDFMVQRKRQRLVRSRIASMQRKQQVVSGVRLISGDIGLDKFHIGIAQLVRDALRLRNHAGVTVQSRKITGLSQYFLDIKIKRKRQVGFSAAAVNDPKRFFPGGKPSKQRICQLDKMIDLIIFSNLIVSDFSVLSEDSDGFQQRRSPVGLDIILPAAHCRSRCGRFRRLRGVFAF